MQSKSFSLREKIRRMFNASSTDSQPDSALLNSSSEPISRAPDVVMSTIETSLVALKEASSLMVKIPYISPVAGLLLQVLTMRDEVKQHKKEWDLVMRKLGRVASLVVNVGESCQKHNLDENYLPPGLRTILLTLQTELGGIERALKQNVEVGGIRKVLLRKDLLQTVKQYDGELSNVLQTFQVSPRILVIPMTYLPNPLQAELVLDVRFAQLVNERKLAVVGPSGPSNITTSIPQEPRSPQIFFGRDTELEIILHMISTGVGSRPARIAILGPGGYGKTALANAVLTHSRIQEHFGSARYFVACESIFSSGALLVELAKTIGVLDEGSDASWSRIHAKLNLENTILCLDNFESPWDQAADVKYSVEELLSRITELHHVTVLITMRGTVQPAQTLWTHPFLPPLTTLTHDAARGIWEQITGKYDDAAGELVKAVDYIPLAINLLAHLAQTMPPALLLREWHKKQTGLIQTGQTHRLFNLEYSIQLSIDSGRMRANPSAKGLLQILSALPDGIHTEQLGRFEEIVVDMDILSNLHVLQQCSLVNVIGERYQTHPIIRRFCNQQSSISPKYKESLQDYYINLASSEPSTAQPKKHAEMVLEVNNTKAMLMDLLKSNYENISKLVDAIITFTLFMLA
ncbi:P-loop containing nucleoside triphosphate hydrolase protein [Multifurca ochricompacta]|uniref:P-loop containing nucleoside triphosphate hydrolase protein n=1 Tax=Multifurca ochricompacta TaxID=376703 RepID=A0AAD4LYF0_9AGAM|nr:P-loop containing nucleoside triphosphate hydrolase protein [Multifurca ochricompacta]